MGSRHHAEHGGAGIGSIGDHDNTNQGSSSIYPQGLGTITINGGTVTATGGHMSAGIGGGSTGTLQAITITGGTVTATPGSRAAAIGTGYNGFNTGYGSLTGATINITGGTVTALMAFTAQTARLIH